MAKTPPEPAPNDIDPRPSYSEKDKKRARQWFAKAKDLRERQNYDYAIESYVTGLSFWPEAIEEGIKPLWSLAVQRQQVGGKKPGMMETMKKSISGKDAKQAMLNALALLAKDPTSSTYVDAVLKNAAKAGYLEVVKWAAERVLESLKRDKKPSNSRFKAYRENLDLAAQKADAWGDPASAVVCYDFATQSVDYLLSRNPGDMGLRDLQRDLSGRLTIARGKYGEGDSFRESLKDADQQKLLHDAERLKQGEQTLEQLLAGLKKQYEENPTVAKHINAYVHALAKTEKPEYEKEAIRVLEEAAEALSNYNFKLRADDIRLRQLSRRSHTLKMKANDSGKPEDRQQYRLARMEELQRTAEIYRERVAQYPTDLRMKAKLGEVLFQLEQYDEAIPVLQEAQSDPRYRIRCQLLIGRAFAATGNPAQAVEVLRESLEQYDRDDDTGRALMYHLGLAAEAAGDIEQAKEAFGRLLRVDYNYANGDARKRLQAIQQQAAG